MFKFKISLRWFLVVVSIVSLFVGLRCYDAANHNTAMERLLILGARFESGFEEPIGPNWIYMGDSHALPPKRYFPTWFSYSFCKKGFSFCDLTDAENDCYQQLSKLVNLRQLRIGCSPLPNEWANSIAACSELESLLIVSCDFDSKDVEALGRLHQVSVLTLADVDLTEFKDEFVKSIQKLRSLKALELIDVGLSESVKIEIRQSLPETEITLR